MGHEEVIKGVIAGKRFHKSKKTKTKNYAIPKSTWAKIDEVGVGIVHSFTFGFFNLQQEREAFHLIP